MPLAASTVRGREDEAVPVPLAASAALAVAAGVPEATVAAVIEAVEGAVAAAYAGEMTVVTVVVP